MDVKFVTSVAVISANPAESRKLYIDVLGLPLEHMGGEYFATQSLEGSKHFGVWPLAEAAQACFGESNWPKQYSIPHASIEFELEDAAAVDAGARELEAAGFTLLHGVKTEPWGQTIARALTDDGIIVGLSYAPVLHEAGSP